MDRQALVQVTAKPSCRTSEDAQADSAGGKLCLVAGEVGTVPHTSSPLRPFPQMWTRYSLRKKRCRLGEGVYFCSMYLEIKVSDPTAGLTFGALKSGKVP